MFFDFDAGIRSSFHERLGSIGSLADMADALIGKIDERDIGSHIEPPFFTPQKNKADRSLREYAEAIGWLC